MVAVAASTSAQPVRVPVPRVAGGSPGAEAADPGEAVAPAGRLGEELRMAFALKKHIR